MGSADQQHQVKFISSRTVDKDSCISDEIEIKTSNQVDRIGNPRDRETQ